MRRVTVMLLPMALAGALLGADNFRVGAKNDIGTNYSNQSSHRVRYAVIDLGSQQKPIRVTNSGIVLLEGNRYGERWSNGKLETLSGGTVADIDEQGTAVGYVVSNEYFFASSVRSRPYQIEPRPFTELAVAWPARQSGGPTVLDSPSYAFDIVTMYSWTWGVIGDTLEDLQKYACYYIDYEDSDGIHGTGYTALQRFKGRVRESRAWTIDAGKIYGTALPPGGYKQGDDCTMPTRFGTVVDGFGWGGLRDNSAMRV